MADPPRIPRVADLDNNFLYADITLSHEESDWLVTLLLVLDRCDAPLLAGPQRLLVAFMQREVTDYDRKLVPFVERVVPIAVELLHRLGEERIVVDFEHHTYPTRINEIPPFGQPTDKRHWITFSWESTYNHRSHLAPALVAEVLHEFHREWRREPQPALRSVTNAEWERWQRRHLPTTVTWFASVERDGPMGGVYAVTAGGVCGFDLDEAATQAARAVRERPLRPKYAGAAAPAPLPTPTPANDQEVPS